MVNLFDEEMLTTQEAADLIHVHYNTICNWHKRGMMYAFKIGNKRQWLFRKDDILALIKREGNND